LLNTKQQLLIQFKIFMAEVYGVRYSQQEEDGEK